MRRDAVRTSSPRFAIGAVLARCAGCSARWLASVRAAKIPVAIVADVRRDAVRTSSPRFAIGAVFARCSGCSTRWLAGIGAANVPVAIVTDVRRNAVRASSPRFAICSILDRGNGCAVHADCCRLAGLSGRYHRAVTVFTRCTILARSTVRALELGHGDKVCPRHAAVAAVLDVAVRYAKAAACPCRLVDCRHQRVMCLRHQVVKVADLALDRPQRHLLRRRVHVVGRLAALVHRKVLLHHCVRAGVVGDVCVYRQRVPVLQQLVRDDGRAVCTDVHVKRAAKHAILVVHLLHAAAHAQAPPGVPLPQRPASICDCDSHMMASIYLYLPTT